MLCITALCAVPTALTTRAAATPWPDLTFTQLGQLLPNGPGALTFAAEDLVWVFDGDRRIELEYPSGRVLSDSPLKGMAGWPEELTSVRCAANLDGRSLLLVDQWLGRDGHMESMVFVHDLADSTSEPLDDALAAVIGELSLDAIAAIDGDLYLFSGDSVHVYGFEEQAIISSTPISGWPGWPAHWATGISAVLVLPDGRACYFRGPEYAWVREGGLTELRSVSAAP